jgi:glycosyltransferase 2 family protein
MFFIDLTRKIKWLTFARVPYSYELKKFLKENIYPFSEGMLIDGCNYGVASELLENGYEILKTGQEAILKLRYNHFKKKSLKELIRRGFRGKHFEEIPFSVEIKERLRKFKLECAHGKEPQLKYLFNDEFEPFNRLFVIMDDNDVWYGAFMLSHKEKNYAQTELILRRKHAPVGVMEALIYSIFNRLKAEGYEYWSLGAVPFTVYEDKLFTKEGLINFVGRRLRFAYDYQGLYFFKNKFNPIWIDYYFCVKHKLRLSILLKVLIKTNLHKLILNKLKYILSFRILNKGR